MPIDIIKKYTLKEKLEILSKIYFNDNKFQCMLVDCQNLDTLDTTLIKTVNAYFKLARKAYIDSRCRNRLTKALQLFTKDKNMIKSNIVSRSQI